VGFDSLLLLEEGIKMKGMKSIIQVRIYKGETYYVAECMDLPVVTQGKTLDELTENLKEALALHMEGEDLSAYDLVQQPSVLASFELEPLTHAKT
jgi:predicted RNase H-like HicB family nuclease